VKTTGRKNARHQAALFLFCEKSRQLMTLFFVGNITVLQPLVMERRRDGEN